MCWYAAWGGSGTQRDVWEQGLVEMEPAGNRAQRRNGATELSVNRDNVRSKLCAMCIVDEDGARLFSDEDIDALGEKSAAPLDRIFGVAMRLSGLGTKDVDKLAQAQLEDPTESGAASSSP